MHSTFETQKGTVTLRPAVPEDAPAYREIRLKSLHDHPTAFSSDYEEAITRPGSFWVDRLTLDQPGNLVMTIFALHQERIIGMSAVILPKQVKIRHSGLLVSVYVEPEWRGLSIADALVTACEAWARSQGASILKLGVTTTNTAAIRCYSRCGYQVYGIEPEQIQVAGTNYSELLMYKKIA